MPADFRVSITNAPGEKAYADLEFHVALVRKNSMTKIS